MLKVLKKNSMEIINKIPPKKVPKPFHEKPRKRDFLLSAKNLYLTYSNCVLSLDGSLEQLKKILSSYIVIDYLLVREYHKNGEPHIHVYLKTSKKCNITSSTFLDLKNKEGEIFHGNYQSAKKKNSVIEYMLKTIPSKSDPNILYSENMSRLIGELADYKTLEEALIDLAEEGRIAEGMLLLKKEDPAKYLSQGSKYEKRMIEIYKDQYLLKQRQYDLENFHISKEMFESLKEYIHRRKQGENPVLAIVGEAGTGKTNFLISFFEELLGCQPLVVKTADGLRHASFFKGKKYAIIFDDLDWKNENMSREHMLHLLSGEVTATSNIKHSTVLVPKDTCRAITSNYSLADTWNFQREALDVKKQGSEITCFNRRLHEINIEKSKLFLKTKKSLSASSLILDSSKMMEKN